MTIPRRRPWFPLKGQGLFLALPPLLLASLVACGGSGGDASGEAESADTPASAQEEPVTLGPADGFDLAPTDLERVAVGTLAPDFTLESLSGEAITLSSFRGARNVVLVFYRGHW
jgi:hypothetical protein